MSWVIWKSSFGLESLDTWFRTLSFGYGLGWKLLNSFSVGLSEKSSKAPRYVFWEGSSCKLNTENSLFLIICSSRTLERVFKSEIQGIRK